MAPVLDVQDLVDLTHELGVARPAGGDGGRDVPGAGTRSSAVVWIGGSGWGRTRRLPGSGSHWLVTDVVEQAHSASVKTLASR